MVDNAIDDGKNNNKEILTNHHFVDFTGEDITSKKLKEKEIPKQNEILNGNVTNKYRDVDEILVSIGEFSKAQILILLIIYSMYVPTIYHTMSWYFTGHSPAWRCVPQNEECNATGVFDVGDNFYESRCSMERDSWEFVEKKSYSVVTEVTEQFFSFVFLTLSILHVILITVYSSQ